MNLGRENEKWKKFWDEVVDPSQVERQLRRLRQLEGFAFHCGPEITPEMFRALQQQIETGDRKLAELNGDLGIELQGAPVQMDSREPEWVNR